MPNYVAVIDDTENSDFRRAEWDGSTKLWNKPM